MCIPGLLPWWHQSPSQALSSLLGFEKSNHPISHILILLGVGAVIPPKSSILFGLEREEPVKSPQFSLYQYKMRREAGQAEGSHHSHGQVNFLLCKFYDGTPNVAVRFV